MDNFNFSNLILEYQSIGVGSDIYDFILKIVYEGVRHYPPSIYSPNNTWDDDAKTSICNDFIFNKLLRKGWLDSYFLSLNSMDELKKVIKRDFRHFLIAKKTRTEKNNLYIRVKKILKDNPKKFGVNSKVNMIGNLCGLQGWQSKDVAQDIQFVNSVISTIRLPRIIRYRPDSAKLSPLISNPELISLIEKTLFILDKQISLDMLFDAICNRLGVLTDETISFEDPIDDQNNQIMADIIPTPNINIERAIETMQAAEDIYEQLSDRQREILRFQFSADSPNLVQIGENLDVSKSTVANEISNIQQIISGREIELSDADPIIQLLKELLIKDGSINKLN